MILEQLRRELNGEAKNYPTLKFKKKQQKEFEKIDTKKLLRISMQKTFSTGRDKPMEKSHDFIFDFKGNGSIKSSPQKTSTGIWKNSLSKSTRKRSDSNITKGLRQARVTDIYSDKIREYMNPLPIKETHNQMPRRSKSVAGDNKSFTSDKYGYEINPEEYERKKEANKLILKQVREKSQSFIRKAMEETQDDLKRQKRDFSEYDRKHQAKLEKYKKLLLDQRTYNTSEMQRKMKSSTKIFSQDLQLKRAKVAMARYIEEKRKNQLNSLERKKVFSKVAQQNISLAQIRLRDTQFLKLQELQEDRDHFAASVDPFTINRRRYNDALKLMNKRADRYHLNIEE
ncbi:unnamed protein product [Moneuplotes crassus]|uniref:Uncharacterized protein n=1 Tax=Euplotes crassus TaxID=5936 RepID=A0AAD1XBM5_EUPCR|nr:unnamed protein product [Moneuplotes crassus]